MSAEIATRVLSRLVEAPSTQTALFEADPGVRAYLSETVAGLARELGLAPEFDAMGNLVVRSGRPGGRRVLIFAYAMTHPVNRMPDPFVARLVSEGGRQWLHGRGAAEQKAAVAAALLAAGRLSERPPAGEMLLCVSTAGETGRHDAARAFLGAYGTPAFDWAIVALGTANTIGLGNKGRIDVLVRVAGRAAHSSTPWAGVNAITGAVEAIRRLEGVRLAGEHPELGKPTLTVTSVRSGPDATHTVQDEVRMTLDRRLLPGDDPEGACADIARALEGMEPWSVEVERGPFMYPSSLAEDAPLVALLQAASERVGRERLATTWSHGAIDAGFFNHQGVPAVMLGPGNPALFHTDDERVGIDDVTFAADLYEAAVRLHLEETRA